MSASSSASRLRIIVDADTGADDALSLLIGCAHTDIALISCGDGNVQSKTAADNTLRLLEATHYSIPVAVGKDVIPSSQRHGRHFADAFPNTPTQKLLSDSAPQELVRAALKEQPSSLTLVCTGPLQNVGEAIRLAKSQNNLDQFLNTFSKVVIMGGLCDPASYPHQLPANAEFNIRTSVKDSSEIWSAPWPPEIKFYLIPIDPVVRCPLKFDDVLKIKQMGEAGCKKAAAAWSVLDLHVKKDETMLQSQGYEIYDAFAMAVAIDPKDHLLVEADVSLYPSGQLFAKCLSQPASTTSWKTQTPLRFRSDQDEKSCPKRQFSVLEDINYPSFVKMFLAALV